MKKSFVTITPARGLNNRALSVKADVNESCVRRSATFKVEGGGITKSLSIEQDPNPYVYIDCGYIFSSVNIEEPYEFGYDAGISFLMFDVKSANFILSSEHRFIIKNVSSLPFEFNNSVISSITFIANGQHLDEITLEEFTTEIVPNSENEGTVLSLVDITPAKINEIVGKINAMRDASTTGPTGITILIKTSSTYENLLITIDVI